MGTLGIVLVAALSPALWQYVPKLLELIFKRKIEATKELKEDGIAFRTYLLTVNDQHQKQLDILIKSNESLTRVLATVREELDTTNKLLEAKDKLIVSLNDEVSKLKTEVEILNNLLKR